MTFTFRANPDLFTPRGPNHTWVVFYVEFYADFKNARLTKIVLGLNSPFDFKEGYPPQNENFPELLPK